MKIIGFSGPPGSGKDSIADKIVSTTDQSQTLVTKANLAWPMRQIGMNLLGVDPTDDQLYAQLKSEEQSLFRWVSPTRNFLHDNLRQFMIWISESALKPRYGSDFWARILYEQYKDADTEIIILVPDFGFRFEVEFFEHTLGKENVLVFQTYRLDCDFSVDSRNYVYASDPHRNFTIPNNRTISDAANHVRGYVLRHGWKIVLK